MIDESETVTLAWCDGGSVEGKFAEGLAALLLTGPSNGIKIHASIRVQGSQISRQRQVVFDNWADNIKTDWLLWVDSDIVVTVDAVKKLWQTADPSTAPVVSGVYFISKTEVNSLTEPYPAIFYDVDEHTIQYVHPLPNNEVIKVDSAGFGFVLMHKSIVPKLRKNANKRNLFMETGDEKDEHFVGEDIVFFRKMKEVGVPLYAHTGALVRHIKRLSLDLHYYALYWESKENLPS